MKLIVGLGNPGFLYAANRHNVGFMCVRHIAGEHRIAFDRKQGHARTGLGTIAGKKVVLARPQTYMNSSGDSVHRLVANLKIAPSDLIVIHDDLDLPVGKIRIRYGRSSGGHKGIDSIIANLGTRDFYRIRVGIGRPDIPDDSPADKEAAVIEYVLSNFTREEQKVIDAAIPEVDKAIVCLFTEGLEAAMNRYN